LANIGADISVEVRPVEVAGETVNGLFNTEVSGDGDVVCLVEEGWAEVGGDVEAVVGGCIEEVVDLDEVVTVAGTDAAEHGLVDRVRRRRGTYLGEDGGSNGEGGADGGEKEGQRGGGGGGQRGW
jgi:hypothetical protein